MECASGLVVEGCGMQWLVSATGGGASEFRGRIDWSVSVAAVGEDDRVVAGVILAPGQRSSCEAALGRGSSCNGVRVSGLHAPHLARAVVGVELAEEALERVGAQLSRLREAAGELRAGGGGASALTSVITGSANAAWCVGRPAAECAAGALIVTEAGGVVGGLRGQDDQAWREGMVLAAPPRLWQELRDVLAG